MAGWGTCFSGSNNIHFNFPPIMNDGRNWASWQPEAVINKRIQHSENIHSNWDYRMFMQKNGNQIMNYNTMESCYELGLNPHVSTGKMPSSNVPFKYNSVFDKSMPGFGYCNSDLKSPYLTKEDLNARIMAPSIDISNFRN
jgi:hypothetical protein